ncbi:S-methyl-5-thioribose-1-phosphate isomerase [uncultured Sphaerochaeta sp.]|uniref:S-methyl-5-thioribose-1-phosphate isomerase n=1 Tax=uncultured Sphaerochaeta sp. TaxID=886478 RepID=UPI0029CA3AB2|nr:S-methyl-5-thioribose-1-phosphate isomerase [uncultured Sphaerochaeta sp.]
MDESFVTLIFKNNTLTLLDQRILPTEVSYVDCKTYEEVEFAIRDMIVRGAPAIGAAAAYGVYLAALQCPEEKAFMKACEFLSLARPTAVNLGWAINRMLATYEHNEKQPREALLKALLAESDAIREEDIKTNKQMSRIGAAVVPHGATILTHCNTGALATAGWGTALGVIKTAFYDKKDIFVYADETRPRFQGARLTAWELMEAKIPSKLIPDSAAATLIRDGKIDLVILGGDRVAANGDVANKLGTFALSVICKAYGVPFYSVVPISTIDFSIPDGSAIPIEEREAEEVTHVQGVQVAPSGMDVFNPAFDVTPHQNLTGIITENGIIYPPFKENIERLRRGETL